jgi:3-oxoacyl-[acyl-carrier protein] reductase
LDLDSSLQNRTALITGASRGVGAVISRLLAERGIDTAINFRSKRTRAELVANEVRALGRKACLVQADLTDTAGVRRMMGEIGAAFGKLDILVLNASGGLEKDKPESYAMDLNLRAQLDTLDAALPLMPRGACVIFVTSHWAHFLGQKPVHGQYAAVATSKKAGEEALLARLRQFEQLGLRLGIVSADMIDGTITPKLLQKSQPGLIAARREQVGALPTVEEFAREIANAATDATRPNGHISFVGPTD